MPNKVRRNDDNVIVVLGSCICKFRSKLQTNGKQRHVNIVVNDPLNDLYQGSMNLNGLRGISAIAVNRNSWLLSTNYPSVLEWFVFRQF